MDTNTLSMKTFFESDNFIWASNYTKYLEYRRKGLRKEGLGFLTKFANDFKSQGKNERRRFLDYVFGLAFISEDYSEYLPVNLYNELLVPEIKNWIDDEPDNPNAYRWSADLSNVKKAVELNPIDQIALERAGQMIINAISMNQHEIQSGFAYDGNPKSDFELITFFEKFITNINDVEKREKMKSALSELKKCANDNL